jgi:hypothetical protein
MTSLADYDLKQKLGAGSFGTVYKAIRKSDGKPVVVKQVCVRACVWMCVRGRMGVEMGTGMVIHRPNAIPPTSPSACMHE